MDRQTHRPTTVTLAAHARRGLMMPGYSLVNLGVGMKLAWLWDPCIQSDIDQLEVVQRFALNLLSCQCRHGTPDMRSCP